MNSTLEWKCKGRHKDSAAQTWQFYKTVEASYAVRFMTDMAPNSKHFDYRIAPQSPAKRRIQ